MDDRNALPIPAVVARDHTAADWGVAPAEITVEAVEPVEWPDTSLGAPEPGMFYAQMITPGYRIRLRAGRRVRVYHTDRGSRAVLVDDMMTDE